VVTKYTLSVTDAIGNLPASSRILEIKEL